MQAAKEAGIAAYTWQQFLDLGRKSPASARPPKPDDLCTVMYTSGTTGDPKVLVYIACLQGTASSLTICSLPTCLDDFTELSWT